MGHVVMQVVSHFYTHTRIYVGILFCHQVKQSQPIPDRHLQSPRIRLLQEPPRCTALHYAALLLASSPSSQNRYRQHQHILPTASPPPRDPRNIITSLDVPHQDIVHPPIQRPPLLYSQKPIHPHIFYKTTSSLQNLVHRPHLKMVVIVPPVSNVRSKDGAQTVLIVTGVMGGVVVLVVLGLLFWCWWVRRRP